MAIADLLMDSMPLGFRFSPSDFELVNHYLKGKISGRLNAKDDVIAEIDVCKCEPWDLPDKSVIKLNDPEWFFFAPKDRKYPTGHRYNRATEAGYWKATGRDRLIKSRLPGRGSLVIGTKKTLVFYLGRAPQGKRTHWIMHEYHTTEPEFQSGKEGSFVLCRLFKKLEENIRASDTDDYTREHIDDMESSDLPIPPPKLIPNKTSNGTEAVVNFVQPLSYMLPKQEQSQSPSPTVINISQVSSEVDADCVTSYPSQLIEAPGSDTLPSDSGDHENDVAGTEVESILGDIASYLDQDPNKTSPADFHKVHSFNDPHMGLSLFDGFDDRQQLDLLQDYTIETSTYLLDSFISDREDCYPEGLFANGNSITSSNLDATDVYSLDSVLSKDSGRGGNMEPAIAQGAVDVVDEGYPGLSSNCSQANNYVCQIGESFSQLAVLPKELLSRRVSFGPRVDSLLAEPDNASKIEGPVEASDLSNSVVTDTIQNDCSLAGIQLKSLQDLTDKKNSEAQQGLATRRLRLRKVCQPVTDSDQENEVMDRNVEKSNVHQVVKHNKDFVRQEKSVLRYISGNSEAGTCAAMTKGNILAPGAGSSSIIRLTGLLSAILFIVMVVMWFLIF